VDGSANSIDPTELFDRYGVGCYRLALAITRDRHDAENAVREAFKAACKEALGAREISPGVRLLELTQHLAVDRLRRRAHREPILDYEQRIAADPSRKESPPDRRSTPLECERRRVQAALDALPAGDRRILALSYLGGYTQAEIARDLGQPVTAIRRATVRALRQLRTTFADMG
jgi:RNA polymerase sigma-70 factor (ECF subfamily)